MSGSISRAACQGSDIPIKSNYINYHDNSEKLINEVLVVNYEKM